MPVTTANMLGMAERLSANMLGMAEWLSANMLGMAEWLSANMLGMAEQLYGMAVCQAAKNMWYIKNRFLFWYVS